MTETVLSVKFNDSNIIVGYIDDSRLREIYEDPAKKVCEKV